MEGLAQELIPFLQYLLPGFVASWIFHSLTAYPRPGQFEQIVQALIFTFLVQVSVTCIKYAALLVGTWWSFGPWIAETEVVIAVAMALILGLAFSFFANNDRLHRFLRKINVTRETSYPSEWYSSLLDHNGYVVLHLNDERRLYGWPYEWPSSDQKGQFALQNCNWLDDDGDLVGLEDVSLIVIDVKDVRWVEFLKTWEQEHVEQTSES